MSKLARTPERLNRVGRLPESLAKPTPTKPRTRAATRERGTWPAGARLTVNLSGVLPVAKGSMRGFVVNGRAILTDSKTPELKALERDVRKQVEIEMNARGLLCAQHQPFELLILYYLPRPMGHFDKHGHVKGSAPAEPMMKPDLDKLERATLDAFTGIAMDDDCRVVRTVKEKRYASAARDIGVWFELRVRPATMRERAVLQQTTIGDVR